MASRLCSSHSSLFNDYQPFSASSSWSKSKGLNFVSSHKPLTPQSKTFLHLNHNPSLLDADSQDPHANSSSSFKNSIWVNPNSPKADQLRKKSSGARYSFLVRLAESLNSCNPSEQQVSRILRGLGDKVLDRDAVLILDKMVNPDTAPLVLRYFQIKIKPTRDKELILYNVTLKVFRKSRDFEGAEKLFDEMLQRGVKPDNITFSTIINCARTSALPHKAVELFEKMPGFGCEPDDITSSAMVYAYARTNNVDMALKLYDRAKAEKWRLDAVTFSTLIKMLGMLGKYDGCLSVYKEMKALGVKPSVATYNTLLSGMLRAKRPQQAKTIYKEMKNYGVSPDFITYASLLRVYAKAHFSKDALGVYKEMKQNGINMSTDMYNILLAMCADVGCIDEAVDVYEDMRSSGTCLPDSWTFSSLITIYSCSGKLSVAEEMLNQMIQSGFEPNIFVLTSLVKCYGKAKRIDDVVKIFKQLLDLGIVPDDRFCCCLLNVMTHTPKEEFGKLTDCIQKANTKLGSVVRYLVEEQDCDGDFRKETSELFDSIDAEVKKPLCNCLIDLCVSLNVPDRAGNLLDLGLMLGIYTDIQSRSETQWSLHLKKLSVGAAMTVLHVWINDLCKAMESGEDLPPLLGINTGQGKHKYSNKGLASVLKSHLKDLNAPFHEATDKAGWLLATNAAAKSWLDSRGSTKSIPALETLV